MKMDPLNFLDAISGYVRHETDSSADRPVRLATIDPAYVSSTYPVTLPKVTFDGETTLSGKRYVAITPGYLPRASDRVVLLPVGNSYVILGSVDQDAANFYGPTVWSPWATAASWKSTGTAPVLGNGAIVSAYTQMGKTVHADMRVTMGSGTTYGTGTWLFDLPVPARASPAVPRHGSAYLRDASAGVSGHLHGTSVIDLAVSSTAVFVIAGPALVSAAVPFTWVSTDHIGWSLTYEAA
jgi:hypothetical protein